MRFLPTESHLAPPQANTAATYQPPIPHNRLLPPRPPIPTPLSPPPPPLLIYFPPSGQWHPPQTEHSGGPLGDPSARVFEVFLIVSQSVISRTLRQNRFQLNSQLQCFYLFRLSANWTWTRPGRRPQVLLASNWTQWPMANATRRLRSKNRFQIRVTFTFQRSLPMGASYLAAPVATRGME